MWRSQQKLQCYPQMNVGYQRTCSSSIVVSSSLHLLKKRQFIGFKKKCVGSQVSSESFS